MTRSESPPAKPRESRGPSAAPPARAERRAAARRGMRGGTGPPRSWLPRALVAAVALAAALTGGVLLYARIAQVQRGAILPNVPQGVQRDPATRARGAVESISGDASHPAASYNPASGTVTVRFQSRYYDPKHTAALNRQYLATEGKLVIQLILYNNSSAAQVVAQLYHGRRLLATVTGAPNQDYAAYSVRYAPGLPK